ncbi:unnamed protein product, partial [Vitis vinifera]
MKIKTVCILPWHVWRRYCVCLLVG